MVKAVMPPVEMLSWSAPAEKMPVLGSPLKLNAAPVAPPRSDARNLRAVVVPVLVREVFMVKESMEAEVALREADRRSGSTARP